ncbi:hypothetical protein Q8A73_000156 [Channa argus]|nr:hypothetical protein Q8A73_000156 [Channa argus]
MEVEMMEDGDQDNKFESKEAESRGQQEAKGRHMSLYGRWSRPVVIELFRVSGLSAIFKGLHLLHRLALDTQWLSQQRGGFSSGPKAQFFCLCYVQLHPVDLLLVLRQSLGVSHLLNGPCVVIQILSGESPEVRSQ